MRPYSTAYEAARLPIFKQLTFYTKYHNYTKNPYYTMKACLCILGTLNVGSRLDIVKIMYFGLLGKTVETR